MNIEEFVKVTEAEIQSFKSWYLKQRGQAAGLGREEEWPLVMKEGDWFEQFLVYEGFEDAGRDI